MSVTRIGPVAALSVLLAAALPLGIARAGISGWQPPQKISADDPDGGMALGLDRAGNAFAAWLAGNCRASGCPAATVRAARLPAGKTRWSRPQTIATAGFPGWVAMDRPEIGRDRRGQPLLVWPHRSGIEPSIRASSFARGRWARPWVVKRLEDGRSPRWVQLATNERGDAALVWANVSRVVQMPSFIEVSARLRNGRWSPTKILVEARDATVAIDRGGNTVAVWNGPKGIESAILRAGSSSWSRPRVIGRGFCPRLGVDGPGNFVAAWIHPQHNGLEVAIRRARSGAWGRPQVVGATPAYCGPDGRPSLAVGRGGMVALAWKTAHVRGAIEATRMRLQDGRWEPPRVISRPAREISPSVAIDVDHRGTIFVVWEHLTSDLTSTVDAVVRRAAAAEWPSPVQLTPSADTRRTANEVVARGKGRALAAWVSTPFGLEIAEFDGR
jgi:hypothetical protein